MKYYDISFNVYSPDGFLNCPDDSEHSKRVVENLFNAEKEAIEILDRMCFEHGYVYTWCDGSLFRYVKTFKEAPSLKKDIETEIEIGINKGRIKNLTPCIRIFESNKNKTAFEDLL